MPRPLPKIADTLVFPRAGRVEWIGLAPARRGHIDAVREARVVPGTGLVGDHHSAGGGKRQVTLVQAEHLAAVGALLEREVTPADLRRNLVVAGLNLAALKYRAFRIGEVVLEGSGPCAPCTRMEENLGPGGLAAMQGHGGITAVVLVGGTLSVGDPVTVLSREETLGLEGDSADSTQAPPDGSRHDLFGQPLPPGS